MCFYGSSTVATACIEYNAKLSLTLFSMQLCFKNSSYEIKIFHFSDGFEAGS